MGVLKFSHERLDLGTLCSCLTSDEYVKGELRMSLMDPRNISIRFYIKDEFNLPLAKNNRFNMVYTARSFVRG